MISKQAYAEKKGPVYQIFSNIQKRIYSAAVCVCVCRGAGGGFLRLSPGQRISGEASLGSKKI